MHEQSETIQQPDGSWINVYGKNTPKAGQPLPRMHDFELDSYPTVDAATSAARRRSELSPETPSTPPTGSIYLSKDQNALLRSVMDRARQPGPFSLGPVENQQLKDAFHVLAGMGDDGAKIRTAVESAIRARVVDPVTGQVTSQGAYDADTARLNAAGTPSLEKTPGHRVFQVAAEAAAPVIAGGVAAAALPATAAVPLLGELGGSGLVLRGMLAAARSLASGGAAVGTRAAIDYQQGRGPMSTNQMLATFVDNALPELIGSTASGIAPHTFGQAGLSIEEKYMLDQAVSRHGRAKNAVEPGGVLDASVRGSRARLAAGQAALPKEAIAPAMQGIGEAGAEAEYRAAVAGARDLPAVVGGGQTPPPQSRYRLGFDTEEAAAQADARVTRQKTRNYDTTRAYGIEHGGYTSHGRPLVESVQAVRDDILALEAEGLRQSPAVHKRIDDIMNRADKAGVGRFFLDYGDLDDMREYLQPYVKGAFDRRTRRTLDQSRIGVAYNQVKEAMGELEARNPELGRLAKRADDYYIHKYKPVFNAKNIAVGQTENSFIADRLIAQPDTFNAIMKELPEPTAIKIRAGHFENKLAHFTDANGDFDARGFSEWWKGLDRRDQVAMTGGRHVGQVDTIIAKLDETLANRARFEANRPLVTDRMGEQLVKMSELERDVARTTAMMGDAYKELAESAVAKHESFSMRPQGLLVPLGLSAAIYGFSQGRNDIGLGSLVMTRFGYRAFATALASPRGTELLYKALTAAPKSKAAIKYGTAFVGQIAADVLAGRVSQADQNAAEQLMLQRLGPPPTAQPPAAPAP